MNDKLKEILESIQLYQKIEEELRKIDAEEERILESSEYRKKINEFAKKFFRYAIIIEDFNELDFSKSDRTYDELLANVEVQVKAKIEKPIESYHTEEDFIEAYNESSDAERQQYGSYENFKNIALAEFRKETERENQELKQLFEEFKGIRSSYESQKQELEALANQRSTLLNDRWSLLATKLKNINPEFLSNKIEFQNGLPLLKEDINMVMKMPELDADNITLDDLVIVHATDYFPENGVIKSSRDAVGSNRNTIHTALNGRVSSHSFGNWDDRGVIILEPLKEHIDQVECIYGVDTFTYGSVKLSSEAIILIDSSKYNELYAQNKEFIEQNKDRIMLYSGNSTVIVEQLLSVLGYAPQKIGQWGWDNNYNNEKLNEFVQTNYPDKLNKAHDDTVYRAVELAENALNSFGIKGDGTDRIITLEDLYALRMNKATIPTKQFIAEVGIFVNDDEIHLLGIKDHINLMKSGEVSQFQIEKVDLLIQKYELMSKNQNGKKIA